LWAAVTAWKCVEVAVEVEVDLLHRHHLGVPTAVAAALDPEHRTHRRLAEAEHHVLADRAESLGQRYGRGGLAFARLRRGDRGGDDQLAVGSVAQPVEDRGRDLGPVPTEGLELLREDPGGGRHVGDRTELRPLGDLES
jgi:hypothetical protein